MAELPMVRSSERGAFKNCPQSWYWRYVEELIPVTVQAGAREFGTGIHLCMAEYYVPETIPDDPKKLLEIPIEERRGRPMLETWDEWCKEFRNAMTKTAQGRKDFNEDEFASMVDMGRFLLQEHMRVYQGDPNWAVMATERTFAANVDNRAIDVGTIDLVVVDLTTGYIWVVDHKTGKGFPNESFYRMDDQGGSYGALAKHILVQLGLMKKNQRVKGVIFNFIRKGKRDERPQNPEGLFTNKPKKEHFVQQVPEHYDFNSAEEKLAFRNKLAKSTLPTLTALAEKEGLSVYGEVSKVQPTTVLKRFEVERTSSQQKHQLQRLVQDVQVMDAVRKGVIPVLKSPGKLCPYCDFFQLCELDESRGDTEGMKQVLFKKLDPYHDHREGAANSKLSVSADKELKY